MELNNMRDFLQKTYNKALGRMQAMNHRQREGGLVNASQSSSVAHSSDNHQRKDQSHLGHMRNGSEGWEQDDVPSPSKRARLERGNSFKSDSFQSQPPQYTLGDARFFVANDGSRDCLALFFTENLITALNDLSDHIRQLDYLQGPLHHTKMDARNLESSIERMKDSLGLPEVQGSEESLRQLQNTLDRQESKLLKARQRIAKLEQETSHSRGQIELCRDHSRYVLETAMEKANILRAPQPPPPIILEDEEEEQGDESSPPQHDSVVSMGDNEPELSPEDFLRQEVLDDLYNRRMALADVQAQFDDQARQGAENLARYEQAVEAGTYTCSRSEFDRRELVYGQKLTGALIDIEAEYDEACAQARALGLTESTYAEESLGFASGYEESTSTEHMASYLATRDWSSIEDWRSDIIPQGSDCGCEDMEMDEWDATTVEISDSASALGCGNNRKKIDRWHRIRGPPLPTPQEDVWTVDRAMLKRRRSF
ncbi:hypothetical protein OEA41_002504 [Lepraria neglecta]|uniref:Uncharacterized protein n=1 Tax=Lepraria neglecta TaxID=209136 RepID=A0AAD9ZF70_9LECA|nr:hypothetical protein OEA41_002504 [Lepraria neglecta]